MNVPPTCSRSGQARIQPSCKHSELLLLALVWTGAHTVAFGNVAINDGGESPVTAAVDADLSGPARTYTANANTPEIVTFSTQVDGRLTPTSNDGDSASGVGVMFERGGTTISDILEVTITQRRRGEQGSIYYFDISGT